MLYPYREDSKDGLKFYTDPKFFFERWCNEQRKDIENNIRKRRRKRVCRKIELIFQPYNLKKIKSVISSKH